MESIIRKIKDVDSNWRSRAYRSLCYLGLALGLVGCGTIKKAGVVALRWYDNIQNGWKRWTLGVRPSYHTRNVVGNMLNAYVIAGTKNPLLYLQAGKLQTKVGAGTPLKETGEYMGTGLSEKELWAVMNSNNIVSRHQYGIDVLQRTEDEMERLAGFKKTGMEKLGTLGADNPFVETGFKYGEKG